MQVGLIVPPGALSSDQWRCRGLEATFAFLSWRGEGGQDWPLRCTITHPCSRLCFMLLATEAKRDQHNTRSEAQGVHRSGDQFQPLFPGKTSPDREFNILLR